MTTENLPEQCDEKLVHRREIKSFVRREGRSTAAQARAMQQLFPIYGIEYSPVLQLCFKEVFGNDHPVWLEIGFGMGQSLAALAESMPHVNFLGIEVHRPGVGSLLNQIELMGLRNVRVMSHDAVEVLRDMIPIDSLARVLLFFPDPWHKTKHHKRRLVQGDFMRLLANHVVFGGVFHSATDWEHYAQWMLTEIEALSEWTNTSGVGQFATRPDYRSVTKFERRGERLGHGVWDLMFARTGV